MSDHFGREISPSENLKDIYGDFLESLGEGAEGIVRQLALGSRNQLSQFNPNTTSIYEEVSDKKTGMTKYEMPEYLDEATVGKKYRAKTRSWMDSGNINVNKANSAMANRKINPITKEIEIDSVSDEQAELNALYFKGATSQKISAATGGLFGDLSGLTDKDSVERQLKAFAKVLEDERAFKEGIKAKLKVAIENTGITDSDLDTIWTNYHP
jgi:hypothetical protein